MNMCLRMHNLAQTLNRLATPSVRGTENGFYSKFDTFWADTFDRITSKCLIEMILFGHFNVKY